MNRAFIRYCVGSVVFVESIFLLLVSLISFVYKENTFLPYFITAVIFGVIGFLAYKSKPKDMQFFAKEGFLAVALSWIALSIVGAIPIFITREIPNYIDALFEIVSGFTTTGSTVINDLGLISHTTLFWRSFTHWIGGMGILVFVLAIFPSAGGSGMHIMRAESPGPNVGKLVSKLSDTAKILYAIYAGITFIQIVCLLICKMPLFDSICLTFGTAGTGGFGIVNDSFVSYSSSVQIVTTIFMIIFGVNFNIYYLILAGQVKDALKSEELRCYLTIIVVSSLAIALNTLSIFENIFVALKHGFFQVASVMTTTGFASYDFDTWPTFSKTILVLVMFVGACAGSTGGGIKVSRIVILFKTMRNNLRRTINPNEVRVIKFEGRTVDSDTVSSIKSYLVYFIAVFVCSILLISLNGYDFTTNLTAVTATINNIGPGLNLVGPMGNFSIFNSFSKLVLIFDMLAGRLELLPMLILFAPFAYSRRRKHKIKNEA